MNHDFALPLAVNRLRAIQIRRLDRPAPVSQVQLAALFLFAKELLRVLPVDGAADRVCELLAACVDDAEVECPVDGRPVEDALLRLVPRERAVLHARGDVGEDADGVASVLCTGSVGVFPREELRRRVPGVFFVVVFDVVVGWFPVAVGVVFFALFLPLCVQRWTG